jgi:RHS repeat-associated protein
MNVILSILPITTKRLRACGAALAIWAAGMISCHGQGIGFYLDASSYTNVQGGSISGSIGMTGVYDTYDTDPWCSQNGYDTDWHVHSLYPAPTYLWLWGSGITTISQRVVWGANNYNPISFTINIPANNSPGNDLTGTLGPDAYDSDPGDPFDPSANPYWYYCYWQYYYDDSYPLWSSTVTLLNPNTVMNVEIVGPDTLVESAVQDTTTIRIYRSDTYNTRTVHYTISGNAQYGADYTATLTGSVTFNAAGSDHVDIPVATIANANVFGVVPPKTLTVTLAYDSYRSYQIGAADSATITLLTDYTVSSDDTDPGTAQIFNPTMPSPNSLKVSRARNGSYTTNGAATNGVVNSPFAFMNVQATSPYAAVAGPTPGVFTITRNGGTNAFTLNYSVTGTATAGSSYTALPASVTFAANQTSTNLLVNVLTNTPLTAAQTVVLTLATNSNYFVGFDAQAVVTLLPNSSLTNSVASPTGRYWRGSGSDPTYWSQVVLLDYEKGTVYSNLNGNCSTLYPGLSSWNSQTLYHYDATNSSPQTNTASRIAFNNPIVAFGERTGGTALYFGQPYQFGIYAGDPLAVPTNLVIQVYYRTNLQLAGSISVVPPNYTNASSMISYATNGFHVSTNAFGLGTTLSDSPGLTWGASSLGAYVLTHTATSQTTNYYYLVELSGYPADGSNAMAITSSSVVAPSLLYTLEFEPRPPWRSIFVDQPQFDGSPLPPFYAGMTLAEMLTNTPPVTNVVSFTPTAATNLDDSPELRRHPILDQFVADMGNDPVALANYVLNRIDLTDPMGYSDDGNVAAQSINPGGVSRGALGTFLEKQGSPVDQCALLVYLLRQAGVPAVYEFAPRNGLQILDARLSRMLKFQVQGAFSEAGQLYTTNTMIAVNYPWVAACIGTNWVHLFPWLKDYEITEGFDLYNYMPTNYASAYPWVLDYIYGSSNLLSLAVDGDDTPRVIFPAFLQQTLLQNYPGISVDDLGVQIVNRQHYYARWQDFPTPTWVTNVSTPLESLTSGGITNIDSALTNIFDTVSVEIYSLSNPTNDIQTGDMRLVDLHNREFYICQAITNTTQVQLSLILMPFRTNITSQFAYANDANLLSREVLSMTLGTNENQLSVHFRYRRNRALSAANPIDPTTTFLGLNAAQEIDLERPLWKGDQAAICMDYGRVTRDMINVHAQDLWQMESAVRANPSLTNSLSPDVYEGETMYLAGLSYYKKVGEFDQLNQNLHKVNTLSSWAVGLSKISPARDSHGSLTNGVDPVLPNLDMFFYQTAEVGNGTVQPDSGQVLELARQNYNLISIVNSSAQEHQTLNHYYQQTNAVSTVRLLQLSQGSGTGIVPLNFSNYVAQGQTVYQGQQLQNWDSGLWSSVVTALNGSPYTIAYVTPGPMINSAYMGMAALILGWSQWQALITPSSLNGAFGEYLPDDTISAANFLAFFFSDLDDPTISLVPPATGTEAAQNFTSDFNASTYYQQLLGGTYVIDPTELSWNATANGLYNLPASDSANQDFAAAFWFAQSSGDLSIPNNAGSGFFDKVLDPVHSITGEFLVDETDLQLPGPLALSLRRNYSSRNLADNQFGPGWKLSLMPYLCVGTGGTNIFAADMDGAVLAYVRTNSSTNVWVPTLAANPALNNQTTAGVGGLANRLRDRLVQTSDGSTTNYTLYGADGSVRSFQVMTFNSGALNQTRPYLQQWTDNRGNYDTFQYGTNSLQTDFGQVRRIQSSNGNYLGFYYDGYGHIIEAYSGDGRRMFYQYDDFGDLLAVTRPDGSQVQYQYQHFPLITNTVDSTTDIALNQSASQSSTYSGGGITYVPGWAVDGNTSGYWGDRSMSITGISQSPWWSVNLGSVHNIRTVKLWSRSDCCPDQTSNLWVFVSSSPITNSLQAATNQPGVSAFYFPGAIGRPTSFAVNCPGQYVQVQLVGYDYLALSEVQVYEPVVASVTTNNLYSTHLLVQQTKPDGRLLANAYDRQRRVTNQLSTAGQDLNPIRTASFVYANDFNITNPPSAPVSGYTLVIDGNNHTNRFDYTNSLITKITDPLNHAIQQTWYPDNATTPGYPRSVSQRIDQRGLVTQYQYDSNGNVTNTAVTGDLEGYGTNSTAVTTAVYNSNCLPVLVVDPVGNSVSNLYDPTYTFLPQQVIKSAGSTPVSTSCFVYGSASNVVTNGSIQITNQSFGLLLRSIRAYNSPDAATNDLFYNGQGFVTNTIQYTGTGDPAISYSLFYNERNELIQRTDASGRSYMFTFDDMGRPTSRETFDTGAATPMDWEYRYYNENGELNWIDGPRYNPEDYIFYDYDGAGRKVQEIHWQSQCNPDGSGVSAVPGYGLYATTFWQYDLLGNPTNIVDPLDNYVVQSFDAIGELVQQVYYAASGAAMATNGFAYEPGGQVAYQTNSLGGCTHKTYTTTGKIASAQYADGSAEQWNYDLAGRVTLHSVRKGNGFGTTTYDDANRRVINTFCRGDTGAPLATNIVQVDRRGNVIQRVDELGNTFTNLFDGLDRLKVAAGPPVVTVGLSSDLKTYITNITQQISTYVYDNCGKILTVSNALGERTVTTRDPLGRPIQVAYYNANGASPVRVTSTYYSPDHNSVTVTNGTGANAIVTTTYTDTTGRPVLTLHNPGNGVIEYTWQQFDANGNRLASQQLSSSGGAITTWATNGWTYDGLNRVITETTKDGAVTTFSYNSLGDVTSRAMPGGLTWSATYNNAGQITFEQDNSGGYDRAYNYVYFASGAYGGALSEVYWNYMSPHIGYGDYRDYTYDFWGRLSSVTTSGAMEPEKGSLATYQYDLRGLATNITYSLNETYLGPPTTVLRGFDAYGRIVSEQTLTGGNALTSVSQSWDLAGRRSVVNLFQGMSIGFTYQADGLMTAAGGSTFGYGNNGLLLGRTNSLRTWFVNQRDGDGRILQTTTKVGGQTVLTEANTWRNDGRMSAYTAGRSDFTDSRGYSYSPLAQRLTQESFFVGSSQAITNNYTIDSGQTGGLGLLTGRAASGSSSAAWTAASLDGFSRVADEQDSLIRRSAYGLAAGAGEVSATLDGKPLSVQFDGPNGSSQWQADMDLGPGAHTLQVSAVDPSGLYFGSAINTFACATNSGDNIQDSYDVDGNVVQRSWVNALSETTRSQTLTWDAFNRLIGVADLDAQNNGYNWSAVYDGLGRRVRTIYTMVVSNTPVENLNAGNAVSEVDSWYDPQVEFLELGVMVNGAFTMKTYGPDANGVCGGMQGVGGLEAINTYGHSAATGVVQDYFGNVIGTIANGAVSWNPTLFSSYGPVPGYQSPALSLDVGLAQSLGWRGKRVDETGYINLGARLYDPSAGRFISADPLGHGASQDLYSFCEGDPVNRFDPDGRLANSIWASMNEQSLREAEREGAPAWQLAENIGAVRQRALDEGAGGLEAEYEALGYTLGTATGFTPAYEGFSSYDIGAANTITDPVDKWSRIVLGTAAVVGTGFAAEGGVSYGQARLNASLNEILDFNYELAGAEGPGGFAEGYGPVYVNSPPNATPAQVQQVQAYVNAANQAIGADALSVEGRVPTQGDLRQAASIAARAERTRAAAAATPYQGEAGHVPDTTWGGTAQPFLWLDLDPSVNRSIGGQANGYPFGYVPTEFIFGPPPGR